MLGFLQALQLKLSRCGGITNSIWRVIKIKKRNSLQL